MIRLYTIVNFSEDRVVDEFLVMRCQTGDRTALSALIAKWQPPFLRYASVITRDRDLAADALQDAWIKIIRALPGLKDPLKFAVWAYRIINNQCIDALRKQKNFEPVQETADTAQLRQLENHEQVWRILDSLSADHRSVLALHYLQGFEVKEIASILRKPQGTVKSRLYHAREQFKQLFDQEVDNGGNHERTGHENTGSLAGSY